MAADSVGKEESHIKLKLKGDVVYADQATVGWKVRVGFWVGLVGLSNVT